MIVAPMIVAVMIVVLGIGAAGMVASSDDRAVTIRSTAAATGPSIDTTPGASSGFGGSIAENSLGRGAAGMKCRFRPAGFFATAPDMPVTTAASNRGRRCDTGMLADWGLIGASR
jgi:hypothetical protein